MRKARSRSTRSWRAFCRAVADPKKSKRTLNLVPKPKAPKADLIGTPALIRARHFGTQS